MPFCGDLSSLWQSLCVENLTTLASAVHERWMGPPKLMAEGLRDMLVSIEKSLQAMNDPWHTLRIITVAAIKWPYNISLPVCILLFQCLYLGPFSRHYHFWSERDCLWPWELWNQKSGQIFAHESNMIFHHKPTRNPLVTSGQQYPYNCPLPTGYLYPIWQTLSRPYPTHHPKWQLDCFTYCATTMPQFSYNGPSHIHPKIVIFHFNKQFCIKWHSVL